LRKYASIILFLILLFNMVGYRAWFFYAEQKADAAMESRLDKEQYDENELVAVTIPLYNPYQTEQTPFERVNGEISFQGRMYKFVKRRISDGNLVLLCIPDSRKTVLKTAKSEFGNAVNDLTGSNKNTSRSGIQKTLNSSDYIAQFANLKICKFENEHVVYNQTQFIKCADPYIAAPGKPPRFRA
jgi:hypothetical protein